MFGIFPEKLHMQSRMEVAMKAKQIGLLADSHFNESTY